MKKAVQIPVALIISLLILASVMAAAISGLHAADEARQKEAVETLNESIRRAAVSCYAIEGRYPDTIDYLADHYGVYIDQEKYVVYYEVFASNLMPDITVFER